jgi:hypothetical protein
MRILLLFKLKIPFDSIITSKCIFNWFMILILGVFMTSCGTKKNIPVDNNHIFDISGLPYFNIPSPPAEYTAENVAARMIDGLGFRYYWTTQGLRKEDLAYKPSDKARTTEETIDHIMGLSQGIINCVTGIQNKQTGEETSPLDFHKKRAKTLQNLLQASEKLKSGTVKLKDLKMVSSSGASWDYWYQLNGPIADALWHVGQVVSFRRSSGNPFDSSVNVLKGTK